MKIAAWWTGRGQHRAADRIPVLSTERDMWMLLALHQAGELRCKDRQLAFANEQGARLVRRIDDLTFENEQLRDDYDQLFARHQAATSVSVPAPADGPAVAAWDPDATVATPVIPLRLAFAPNPPAAA